MDLSSLIIEFFADIYPYDLRLHLHIRLINKANYQKFVTIIIPQWKKWVINDMNKRTDGLTNEIVNEGGYIMGLDLWYYLDGKIPEFLPNLALSNLCSLYIPAQRGNKILNVDSKCKFMICSPGAISTTLVYKLMAEQINIQIYHNVDMKIFAKLSQININRSYISLNTVKLNNIAILSKKWFIGEDQIREIVTIININTPGVGGANIKFAFMKCVEKLVNVGIEVTISVDYPILIERLM